MHSMYPPVPPYPFRIRINPGPVNRDISVSFPLNIQTPAQRLPMPDRHHTGLQKHKHPCQFIFNR